MLIKFDKMQALGNDFVMIDEDQPGRSLERNFVVNISDRKYGIGCDTVVLYKLRNNQVTARFFNADGSEAEICGNAARCIGLLMKKRYQMFECVLDAKGKKYFIRTDEDNIRVEMGRIENVCPLNVSDDLGLPDCSDIYAAYYASIGNPHLVFFGKKIFDEKKIISMGSIFSKHSLFENGVNVSFAYISSKNEIILSVFERGAGLTFACGSGACASAALAYKNNLIRSKDIFVHQKGGDLQISIDNSEIISQIGSAFHVFSGEMEI